MEEKVRMPEGFFDKDKLLVDQDIENPFQEEETDSNINMYPYEDEKSKGYIRYIIRGKSLIILDCVVTANR
jgi:hypothetical protein